MLDPTTIQMAPDVCLRLQIIFLPCPTRRLHIVSKNIHSAQSLLYIFSTSAASSQVRQKTAKRLRVTQNDSYDDP
jgi:hypothetical protein